MTLGFPPDLPPKREDQAVISSRIAAGSTELASRGSPLDGMLGSPQAPNLESHHVSQVVWVRKLRSRAFQVLQCQVRGKALFAGPICVTQTRSPRTALAHPKTRNRKGPQREVGVRLHGRPPASPPPPHQADQRVSRRVVSLNEAGPRSPAAPPSEFPYRLIVSLSCLESSLRVVAVIGISTLASTLWAQGELEKSIQDRMDAAGLMGFGGSVIVDGKVVWQKGFGFADWRRQTPFTPDTMAAVASVSKPMIGVAMMQGVEEGKLNLDQDINQLLPFKVVNPRHPSEKITLRHLATHTSGITDRWEAYRKAYWFDGDPKQPLGDYLKNYLVPGGREYAEGNFLDAKPGEQRDYSNIGASLAGYIVERALGKSLDQLTKERIFQPLQMKRSGWFFRDINPRHLSQQFASQNGHIVPLRAFGSVTYPDGGLKTSVSDLTKFFTTMLNDGESDGVRILRAASAREMQRFQFTEGSRPKNFPADQGNSGLFWRTKMNGRRVGHGGNDPGVAVEMMANLDRSIGIVFICNTSVGGDENRVFGDLIDLLWKHGEAVKKGS